MSFTDFKVGPVRRSGDVVTVNVLVSGRQVAVAALTAKSPPCLKAAAE